MRLAFNSPEFTNPMKSLTLVLALLLSCPAFSQEKKEAEPAKKPEESKKDEKPPEEKTSRTEHSVVIDGRKIQYTAVAGTMNLRKEKDGKFDPVATVFYVAYTRTDAEPAGRRPIMFSFNGGPGSSSVWLHLGALGPKRVALDDEGQLPPPPHRLADNPFSILDATDLVFIDPVSTGYSRAVPGQNPDQFHGVEEDIQSVGEFIRLYTTRNKRWVSPKFLIGESYGTTRAAGLSGFLQDEGMYLNGIVLVSSVLNFQTLDFGPGNDLPYVLYLPTYTAAAWRHGVLDKKLQDQGLRPTLAEAENFAKQEYATGLLKGAVMPDNERNALAGRIAYYTGLSSNYVIRSGLRVPADRFFKELLRSQGKTVGRYDARYTGADRDDAGEQADYDPSYSAVLGPFTAGVNQYVREDLGFESDLPYEVLTGRVHPWNFGNYRNRYVNVAETLRSALVQNPYLKVHVACGYYDLATPYLAANYTFDHLPMAASLRQNISMSYYEAGHMMYLHHASLVDLRSNLTAFIASAVSRDK
jgi:carboxypeptidase C (cathepsin A)